jgi:hypothetical protein
MNNCGAKLRKSGLKNAAHSSAHSVRSARNHFAQFIAGNNCGAKLRKSELKTLRTSAHSVSSARNLFNAAHH